jgi:hypothetical protein
MHVSSELLLVIQVMYVTRLLSLTVATGTANFCDSDHCLVYDYLWLLTGGPGILCFSPRFSA